MHCHTFFSYNAYGYSPSGLAWLAKKNGYAAIGIVDFDVLDGVDEFLDACELLGVRGSAGIETRVFVPEFATREINSPGEPGVYYHMGIGFTSGNVPPEVAPILASMRERAARRNRAMLERINAHLAPLEIDYEADVLPLTPSGNATERHMLAAYLAAAERRFPAADDRAAFWAGKLSLAPEQVAAALQDDAKFSNLVRGKLMKQGGVGYVKPSPDSFPTLDEVNRADYRVRRAALCGVARRAERGRRGDRRVARSADGERRGHPQHHPRPQLEPLGPGPALPEGAEAVRGRTHRGRAQPAAERRHRDEQPRQPPCRRLLFALPGAGQRRVLRWRVLYLRPHGSGSGLRARATRASGPGPSSPTGRRATPSTRPPAASPTPPPPSAPVRKRSSRQCERDGTLIGLIERPFMISGQDHEIPFDQLNLRPIPPAPVDGIIPVPERTLLERGHHRHGIQF